MKSITIIGAGPSGASAALFLARRGHQVSIFDKQTSAGLTHSYQGHSFLAKGINILEQEVPDVVEKLLHLGAGKVDLNFIDRRWNLLARRSLFDDVLKKTLVTEKNVTFFPNEPVVGLLYDSSFSQIKGVKTKKNEYIAIL